MRLQVRVIVALTALIVSLFATVDEAAAHARYQSYIYFDVTDGSLSGRLEVTFADLAQVLELDDDADGTITEAEVLANRDKIYGYLLADRFMLHVGDARQTIVPTEIEFLDVGWDTFALMRFDVPGLTRVPDEIDVTYRFLFDGTDPIHLGFALLASNTRTGLEENEANFSLAFLAGAERQTLSLIAAPWPELLWSFVKAGGKHILSGLDHVLLLIALGIAAALYRRDAFGDLRENLLPCLAVSAGLAVLLVTGQAVAGYIAIHEVIRLPDAPTLALTAASLSVAAAAIAVPSLLRWIFGLAFVFGALHGLGYDHLIGPVDVEPNRKLLTVLGLSLGSGIATVAVMLATTAVAVFAFQRISWDSIFIRVGGGFAAVLAAVWAEERVFDLLGPLAPRILAGLGL